MENRLVRLISKICMGVERFLLLGEIPEQLIDNKNGLHLSIDKLEQLADQGQFDVVVVNGLLERLEQDQAEHLIAELRDIHARQLLLVVPAGSSLGTADLVGLGLRKIADTGEQQVWYFALENYKRVPDWLNSKYWANPELYGKYRW